MRRALIASIAFVLSGCSQGGGGGSGSGVRCESPAADTAAQQSSADPYESRGKVLFDSKDTLPQTDEVLSSGTELAVSIEEPCVNPGAISSDILSRNEAPSFPNPAGVRSYLWKLPEDTEFGDLVEQAQIDSCVIGVSESAEAVTNEYGSDPLVAEQGHLKYLEAAAAHDFVAVKNFSQLDRSEVTIAVIDTGIDMKHPDLKPVLWVNADEIAGNKVDDDKNGYVDDVNGYNFASNIGSPQYQLSQHGTHVSGLAAAKGGNGIGGSGSISAGAKIMMLNVFGNTRGANNSNVANAIRYAADNGAQVINMSIGGVGKNAKYEAAIAYAIQKGAMVFAAAGNENREIGPKYFMSPGSYGSQFAGMMAVGSVDSSNSKISSFSNFSSTLVEIAAPGSEESRSRLGVLSTWPGGGYKRIQGTSMATPVASGGAAVAIRLMRAKGYSPSPATIEGILKASSRRLSSLEGKFANGAVLNLKLLAQLIDASYPDQKRQTNIDPGAGQLACD